MYSTTHLTNNILDLSFHNKNYINIMTLNRIMYLISSEYLKMNNGTKPLITELFITGKYGPYLESTRQYYEPLNNKPIKKFMKNVNNESQIIDLTTDKNLSISLSKIWNTTSLLDWKTLTHITRQPESAWDKAYQNNKPYIDNKNLHTDYTYYKPLGLQK